MFSTAAKWHNWVVEVGNSASAALQCAMGQFLQRLVQLTYGNFRESSTRQIT
jgi:hypothetical protein